jgi:hypothetical protein
MNDGKTNPLNRKDFTRNNTPGEVHRFETHEAAIAQLNKDFNDWSAILTQNSVNASYAIIAANWAVHGSTGNILSNNAAKWSIGIVLLFLGANLLGSFLMSKLHYDQFLYAEQNPRKWEAEWEAGKSLRYWPYTKGIEFLGVSIRRLKVSAPITACLFFIASLF